MVGRLLPFRKKRQVGPFTFIDHMGPAKLGNGKYIDVDQHPHIGLSTLTYLFEGQIEHQDSTGSFQIISPGDVGFMTSGSGVTHTERTPKDKRNKEEFTLHGYQVWVALPKEKEEIDPHLIFIQALAFLLGKQSPLSSNSSLEMHLESLLLCKAIRHYSWLIFLLKKNLRLI